jgi:hypothetical protein
MMLTAFGKFYKETCTFRYEKKIMIVTYLIENNSQFSWF